MPVPSTPQDLINLIREKLFNNTSGKIDEPSIREVLEWMVKVLDAKFSFFSPTLTEEQYSQWNLMLDYMVRETKGVLTTTSPAPTGASAKGKYILSGPGTYTNLGGLVATADKLNYAYFNGSTWSLIAVDVFDLDKQYEAGIDISSEVSKENGFYINVSNNGVKDPVSGYSATEFINISDVNYFEVNPNNYHQFAYYTKEKTFLSGALFATRNVKKPKGAYYVRFTLKNDEFFLLKLFRNAEIENLQNKLSLYFSNNGYYVNATNGSKESLSSYSYSDFIPVKAGDIIRYKLNGWESGPNPKHLTFFDSEQKYLFGNTNSETNTATEDGFVVFSTETELFGKTILTINNADLSLKNGNQILLERKNLKGFAMVNFCTVSKDGGGDFKTINEAVEFGKNLGTEKEKFIIYLMPGIYIEHVNIAPYHIDIIGFDREKCIIQTNNGDYYNVPLNVSGRNSGSNFTAYATNSEGNTPSIWAYGIHCDASGKGRSVWNNCNFLSTVNAGVGLGTQHNQQYEFINCRIENLGTNYDGGGLYMHNSPYGNHKNMSVWVENCVISTKKTITVIIDDANANAGHNDDDGTIFTFINNNCWSEINGKNANSIQFSNAPTSGDIGQIKIGLRSFGNNVIKLNK